MLLREVRASANAFEQQRFRDAVIAHGAAAIDAIRRDGWLCDRALGLFSSQIVREVGRKYRGEAAGALEEALVCADAVARQRILGVADDLGITLRAQVGRFVPSYMDREHVHHVVADVVRDTSVPEGEIYLSECGWVFEGPWVKRNLHHLDNPSQQLCGHCQNAMARSK